MSELGLPLEEIEATFPETIEYCIEDGVLKYVFALDCWGYYFPGQG